MHIHNGELAYYKIRWKCDLVVKYVHKVGGLWDCRMGEPQ